MHDLKDALRTFMKRPGFAATIVITLALGIGANALVFSVVHAVLLRPLPYPEPQRLVTVWETFAAEDRRPVAPANFLDWRSATSFDGLAAYSGRRRTLVSDEPERISIATVSSNFFGVLGVTPVAGRVFNAPLGDGGMREVVLRDDFWRRRFGADPSLIGRTIRLDEETFTVVGVVSGAHPLSEEAVAWMQARHDVPEIGLGVIADVRPLRDAHYFGVIGRLKSGVTRQQAQAEMNVIAERLRGLYPANRDVGVNVVDLQEQVTGGSSRMLWILAATVMCVLGIACANVAILLLANAAGRHRELSIRAALGASRTRMMRQLSVESLLLSLAGVGGGLLLAWFGRAPLLALLPTTTPRTASVAIDWTTIAFSLVLAVITAFAFGVGPALVASHAGFSGLRDGGRSGPSRGSTRAASTLVVAQLALALVLVTGTGLMLRALWMVYQRDIAMDVQRLLVADVMLPDARSRGRAASALDFERIVERLTALPGVTGAAGIQALPLSSAGPSANIRVEGRVFPPNGAPDVSWRTVTADYFRTVGTPVVRGRPFNDRDREGAPPVAIINESMARLLWPEADPLGARIGTGLDGDGALVTVVGIIADTPQQGLAGPARPTMYRPLAQPSRFGADAMALIVRTDGDPARLGAALRQAVAEIRPQAPVSSIRPMATVAATSVATEISAARALALFGGLALLLAGIGLHGVMARLVGDRTRELGVRLALGATPGDVRRLVLARTIKLASAGIVAGAMAAYFVAQPLRALMHGVSAADPAIFSAAAAILLAAALLATYPPARRAGRIDPVRVIKGD